MFFKMGYPITGAFQALSHAHGCLLSYPGVKGQTGQEVQLPGIIRVCPGHLSSHTKGAVTHKTHEKSIFPVIDDIGMYVKFRWKNIPVHKIQKVTL